MAITIAALSVICVFLFWWVCWLACTTSDLRAQLTVTHTELRTCRETFVYDMEIAEAVEEARGRVKQ